MKQLHIPLIKTGETASGIDAIHVFLEEQTVLCGVDTLNWPEFSTTPQVTFRIGHGGDRIWLKYYVREKHLLSSITGINGPVHRDSCVEFFFSPCSDGFYYNLEFNCTGVPHVSYGSGRGDRSDIDPVILRSIETRSSLGPGPLEERNGDFFWELALAIPVDIFVHDGLHSFGGLRARGNFYKCGDDTPEPHYLSWNPVKTEKPDFHRYESFGELIFE
ncbi:MAG: hypothetical protein CVV44_11625 [Spirochaetae bacterium HGW-Spirochaetae-1]|jgi:hypothetical protein|nr:MAG: hypothetical protein CVV44_11625 [Spirochaetae bacterium HGW-Spirochaetae-1]